MTDLTRHAHDSMFRHLVSDPKDVAVFLRENLPEGTAALIDPNRMPERVGETFVDGDGRKIQADALFKVYLRGSDDAYVYVLFEHKSSADAQSQLQVLRYKIGIWLDAMKNSPTRTLQVPQIWSFIIYNGKAVWDVPNSVRDMIELHDGQTRYDVQVDESVTRDLKRIPMEDLSRNRRVRSSLMAMRSQSEDSLTDDELAALLAGIEKTEQGKFALRYILRYTELSLDRVREGLKHSALGRDIMEDIMATAAQELTEQGRKVGLAQGMQRGKLEGRVEGRLEGIVEGKAETFLRQARLKFGDLSSSRIATVRKASIDKLDVWLERLMTAKTLDDVFGGHRRH